MNAACSVLARKWAKAAHLAWAFLFVLAAVPVEAADNADIDWRLLTQQVRQQRDQATQQAQDAAAELAISRQQLVDVKKHAADLDAYLKACGDKPGCTVPVTPAPAK